jgi:hypothetical protein
MLLKGVAGSIWIAGPQGIQQRLMPRDQVLGIVHVYRRDSRRQQPR